MFSTCTAPDDRTSAVDPLSNLSDLSNVYLCPPLTFVSFVRPPLSDDRRLAQMTKLAAFVEPSRASFTHRKPGPCVSMRCPWSHSPRSPGVPRPYLDSSGPLLLSPLCVGLQGEPQRRRHVPNSQFAAATNALYCCFLLRFGGKIGCRRWRDIGRDGLISLASPQIYRFCFVPIDCKEKTTMMMIIGRQSVLDPQPGKGSTFA